MSRFFGTASLLAVAGFAASSLARGDVPARARVTIRGTGHDVTIDRTEASIRKRPVEKRAEPLGAFGHTIELKLAGADDSTLIAYLRAHQSDLPPVIEASDVRRLRRAGAGKAVVAFLTTVAAVDIGETGEGSERTASAAFYPAPAPEVPVYAIPYGYAAGGYALPHGRHHHTFPRPHMAARPRHPMPSMGFRPIAWPTAGAIAR